ncbi:MAG: hypothetical protein N2C14_28590, partial [Planctomycetales bacterium]
LLMYGMRIGEFVRRQDEHSLDAALESQQKFWLWAGVLTMLGCMLGVLWGLFMLYAISQGAPANVSVSS